MPIKQNLNLNKILTPGQLLCNHLAISSENLLNVIITLPELGQDFVFEHVRYFRSVSFVVEVILSVLLVLVEDGAARSEERLRHVCRKESTVVTCALVIKLIITD